MSFLSNNVRRFLQSIRPGYLDPSFHTIDDIFAVVVSSGFAIIQAYVMYRITCHLRKGGIMSASRAGVVSQIAHVGLALAYLVSATLVVVNFMMKFSLVAKRTILDESASPAPECQRGYSELFFFYPPACFENKWLPLFKATEVLDVILHLLFPFMLLLADGLMLYRCFINFKHPWTRAVQVAAGLRLGWFFFSPIFFRAAGLSLITTYISLLTSLLTSAGLIAWLWHEKRGAGTSDSECRYGESFRTVILATLPPIVLGFVHVGLLAGIGLLSVGLNALWLSFTVLAPQIITLAVFEQGDSAILNGKQKQAIILPEDTEHNNA